jgi:hypothetical protein
LLLSQKRHMGEYLHDLEVRAELEGIELWNKRRYKHAYLWSRRAEIISCDGSHSGDSVPANTEYDLVLDYFALIDKLPSYSPEDSRIYAFVKELNLQTIFDKIRNRKELNVILKRDDYFGYVKPIRVHCEDPNRGITNIHCTFVIDLQDTGSVQIVTICMASADEAKNSYAGVYITSQIVLVEGSESDDGGFGGLGGGPTD